jgi:hypothetical protein
MVRCFLVSMPQVQRKQSSLCRVSVQDWTCFHASERLWGTLLCGPNEIAVTRDSCMACVPRLALKSMHRLGLIPGLQQPGVGKFAMCVASVAPLRASESRAESQHAPLAVIPASGDADTTNHWHKTRWDTRRPPDLPTCAEGASSSAARTFALPTPPPTPAAAVSPTTLGLTRICAPSGARPAATHTRARQHARGPHRPDVV